MHVGDLGRHEARVVHLRDRGVGRGPPDAGVRGDPQPEVAGGLEGPLLGELRRTGHVEGELQPQHVVGRREVVRDESPELGRVRPLPRRAEVVAVREHEPPGDLAQRLHRGGAVLGIPQPVRPVEGRGDPGVDRLEGAQQVARVDVLRTEDLAPLQVVEDEVLAECPVSAVAAQRGLPHVPVAVDEPRGQDAAARVDLEGALRHLERRADGLDRLAAHEDVAALDDAGRVDRDDGRVAEDERSIRGEFVGTGGSCGRRIRCAHQFSSSRMFSCN